MARRPGVPPEVLRRSGFLTRPLAEHITDWFTGPPTASRADVLASYAALEHDTTRLFALLQARPDAGGLGVRVRRGDGSAPYRSAAELCAELREHGSMTMTSFGMVAAGAHHPFLRGGAGGIPDQLLAVHDVLGHAALGVGFDLQSEFATWLQCQALFSPDARGAAFCELVGRVTAYIVTGEQPAVRADLPPAGLLAACEARNAGRPHQSRRVHQAAR